MYLHYMMIGANDFISIGLKNLNQAKSRTDQSKSHDTDNDRNTDLRGGFYT